MFILHLLSQFIKFFCVNCSNFLMDENMVPKRWLVVPKSYFFPLLLKIPPIFLSFALMAFRNQKAPQISSVNYGLFSPGDGKFHYAYVSCLFSFSYSLEKPQAGGKIKLLNWFLPGFVLRVSSSHLAHTEHPYEIFSYFQNYQKYKHHQLQLQWRQPELLPFLSLISETYLICENSNNLLLFKISGDLLLWPGHQHSFSRIIVLIPTWLWAYVALIWPL